MITLDDISTPAGLEAALLQFGGARPLARELGVSRGCIHNRATRWGIPSYGKKNKGNITYENCKESCQDDFGSIDDLFDAMENLVAAKEAFNTKQTELTVTIDADKPIGVCGWSDWHLGDDGTDYPQFRRDVDIFTGTPGLYYIGLGDYINGVIEGRPKGSQFEEVVRPGLQDVLAFAIAEKTKNAAIALVRGCHDDFLKQSSDRDFVDAMSKKADCANMWHGGLISIDVGGALYEVRARHKYPFNSKLNPTNSQRRQIDMEGPCDIVMHGHLHYPDFYHGDKAGREIVLMRAGSYKHVDEFGQKIAGYKGLYGAPMVILYPKSKKMMPFKKFEDGLHVLQLLRAE